MNDLSPRIIERLQALLGPKGCITDRQDMLAHLAEPRDLWHGRAAAVLKPASTADVAAVVSFHGGLSTDDPDLAKHIKANVLAMNGADDKGTMPDADKFMDEMRMSPAEWQFVVFGHTVHCFAEPSAHSPPGCVYNPKAAKRAFKLMHDWLDEAFAAKG